MPSNNILKLADTPRTGCDIHFYPGIALGFFIAKLANLQYG
jgi:hypothetical protein